ncbi:MAG: aspartate aminotransferase family protein [Betaproteobacteria bacterium]
MKRAPSGAPAHPGAGMAAEGDINLTPLRREWDAAHVGPATRTLLDDDARYFLHQSLSTPCFDAVVGAEGIYLIDTEGRRLMDFHGNSVHQVGYGHPRVIEAVKRQLDVLPFSPRRFTNATAVELARRLLELAPAPLGKVLFAPGGTSAIGMALKLARVATGRHKTISMWDAFHGASLDAISIGGEAAFRRNIGPLLSGTEHVPPCDPGHCPYRCAGRCNLACADYVEYVLDKEQDVAAVVVETIRSTDVQIPPPEYYQRLRRACDRHGTLLILDEIPIALGRSGKFFAFEHYGIVPDMVVLGKGLGGAVFPLAALIARADLDVAGDIALGHYTHEKSSVGCAAALATLDVIADEGLLAHATELGAHALSRLRALQARHPLIGEARGVGLLLAVELRDPHTGAPAAKAAERTMYECLARGLSFKVGQGNVLTLGPPLVITAEQMDEAIGIIDAALDAVAKHAARHP